MTFGVEKVVGVVGKVRDNIDLEGNRLFDSTQDTVDSEQNIRVTDSSELSYGRGNGTPGTDSQAIGINAKADTDFTTATGSRAAQNNTGNKTTATGTRAARDNTGTDTTATGFGAARNNTGNSTTATGFAAARGDGLADPTTMGDDNIGIGVSAIRNNQASGLIAIGQEAGINAQQDDQLIITDRNGNRRMVMDLTNGDLKIEGSLTQNATL
jgi:hypothetical protein